MGKEKTRRGRRKTHQFITWLQPFHVSTPAFFTVRKGLSVIEYNALPKPSSICANQDLKFKVSLLRQSGSLLLLTTHLALLQSSLCCSNIPHTFNLSLKEPVLGMILPQCFHRALSYLSDPLNVSSSTAFSHILSILNQELSPFSMVL